MMNKKKGHLGRKFSFIVVGAIGSRYGSLSADRKNCVFMEKILRKQKGPCRINCVYSGGDLCFV